MKELRKRIIGIGIQHLSPLPKHSRAGLEHSNTRAGLDPASAFFHSGNGRTDSSVRNRHSVIWVSPVPLTRIRPALPSYRVFTDKLNC
jgi:hypothetical protein